MEKSSRILVTGHTGLVGSAIVRHLKGQGFVNVQGANSVNCDLRSAEDTLHKFNTLCPEYVFHCAARVYGIMGNMKNQGLSYFENTVINTNVIEAARKARVRKI